MLATRTYIGPSSAPVGSSADEVAALVADVLDALLLARSRGLAAAVLSQWQDWAEAVRDDRDTPGARGIARASAANWRGATARREVYLLAAAAGDAVEAHKRGLVLATDRMALRDARAAVEAWS